MSMGRRRKSFYTRLRRILHQPKEKWSLSANGHQAENIDRFEVGGEEQTKFGKRR